MKKNRTVEMRRFALRTAIQNPNSTGLNSVNAEARNRGEREYPPSTWYCLVRYEVPRVKKYPDFFEKHTESPRTFTELQKQWPL